MGKYCPLCNNKGKNFRYRIDEAQIRASFRDGGIVADDFSSLMRLHFLEAKSGAPVRTGRLRALHYSKMGPATAAPARSYYVGTTAGYAKFLQGTAGGRSGRIRGKAAGKYNGFMLLRPIPYSWFRPDSSGRFQKEVSGQNKHYKADWLIDAAKKAFVLKGLLDFRTGRPIR
jgi:hypothetical protein